MSASPSDLNPTVLAAERGEGFLASSFCQQQGSTVWLEQRPSLQLLVLAEAAMLAEFQGEPCKVAGRTALRCPCTPHNAAVLARLLPWLEPRPLGKQASFGFGDRLGNATPGHIAALRAADPQGTFAPVFAQQSVRENSRLKRSAHDVIAAARWGLLQQGWQQPWGADADHIKSLEDIAPFLDAGYSFYTIDPSDYVDNAAQHDDLATLRRKVQALPWQQWGSDYASLAAEYLEHPIALATTHLHVDETQLLRALAKYGRALLHTFSLSQHICQARPQGVDIEMSVDETDTPTSPQEHYFIANELLRRDVPLVSLAPRFVGKFQKAVDYMGDIRLFEESLARHAAIMQHFDAYKLSVHTGSDKFSIYGLIQRYCQGRLHVKTAGTSYLEALRVIAAQDVALFRRIVEFSRERFAQDRASYFLDADPTKVAPADSLQPAQLEALLEDFDARQMLHVTFGSVLEHFHEEIFAWQGRHQAAYDKALQRHFCKHLEPLVGQHA